MLLENPEEKILAIAYDVGFQSKSTFNAAFATLVKMTPYEFREKNVKSLYFMLPLAKKNK